MSELDMNDDELKNLLRSAAPEPPHDAVDWAQLHTRITDRTTPLIRRRTTSWWLQLAQWSPRGVPAAAAAAALAAVLLVVLPGAPEDAAEYRVVEEVLAEGISADAMALLVPNGMSVVDALLFNEEVEP